MVASSFRKHHEGDNGPEDQGKKRMRGYDFSRTPQERCESCADMVARVLLSDALELPHPGLAIMSFVPSRDSPFIDLSREDAPLPDPETLSTPQPMPRRGHGPGDPIPIVLSYHQ